VGLGHFVWILDLLVVLILTGTISLLAIDESIQEVALRRAEGATVFQVVMPVLLEGAWLSLAAMGPGIVLGMKILEYGIEPILGWPSWLPPTMIGGTCLALLVTALLGSMLPAWRVARLDPAMVLGGRRDLCPDSRSLIPLPMAERGSAGCSSRWREFAGPTAREMVSSVPSTAWI
jgi:putative ABC transport system permease protein